MICAPARQAHPGGRRGGATYDALDPSLAPDVPVVVAPARVRWPSLGNVLGRSAGWTVVVVGVVLMPLPGPGTLVVVAGLRILVPYHRWAAASYDRVRDRAVGAARAGVATWPRVAASVAGVLWVAALSGMYAFDVSIPRMSLLGLTVGPALPFRSTATAVGLVVSSLASVGATVYSIVRLRPHREPA
ncbi:PGPGW domain-containing protein [Nocardioides sp.]|uniref:PGPGW domain-containing protein n=1 Tax=Nocardioides sp. TaxID=35761 RepID=UPI002715EEBE|nr:PGPGW domain-containing protein [Nocardioides sp.]MDO9457705.1 PGPGW domain-containing protein [Nocardioides sp.]